MSSSCKRLEKESFYEGREEIEGLWERMEEMGERWREG